ncbi:pseudouridine synthase [Cylindrobasidium torrendii FP15055 ss-10]|uniref:Pseudouridine synthase n=1 Tax=Cylindrobasidium torrendii FP15055 ss-10 TaxID=1314674 RepID=A0A0D7BUB7_9AGAR|nr:pseudouridine synthase [Cylindrobasidium torrendii FP15055 ss-10]
MTALGTGSGESRWIPPTRPGLRKIPPYWYPYSTYAKQRWIGREILEIVSTEFRDRSMEYYRYALESGVTTLNRKIAKPTTIVRDGDLMENVVHRHEPPVTSTPVQVIFEDKEREFIVVNKPGSIPVHATGRYFKNTLIEILTSDFGYEKVYSVNRLDRLTSGLMILPTSAACARDFANEFLGGTVQKEYVARVRGEFPEGEVTCEEPLLTVDRQMGLNIVHPEGKHAKTIFNRIRYDAHTNSSVVHCKPVTGRSHQIRVHLQYMGYPIANDPVYSDVEIWGEACGKGGVDLVINDEREAPTPTPPTHLKDAIANGNPESLAKDGEAGRILLPRETGEDIGMGSPVPLSDQAVGIISSLRNMKDKSEDWGRWKDVVFRAKAPLRPPHYALKPPPARNRKRKGKAEFVNESLNTFKKGAPSTATIHPSPAPTPEVVTPVSTPPIEDQLTEETVHLDEPKQLSTDEALQRAKELVDEPVPLIEDGQIYCPDCYLPLHPDPKPEKLYIFLHALRYTTSLGSYETEMPEWSHPEFTWDLS